VHRAQAYFGERLCATFADLPKDKLVEMQVNGMRLYEGRFAALQVCPAPLPPSFLLCPSSPLSLFLSDSFPTYAFPFRTTAGAFLLDGQKRVLHLRAVRANAPCRCAAAVRGLHGALPQDGQERAGPRAPTVCEAPARSQDAPE
jgi:hypothetical protein